MCLCQNMYNIKYKICLDTYFFLYIQVAESGSKTWTSCIGKWLHAKGKWNGWKEDHGHGCFSWLFFIENVLPQCNHTFCCELYAFHSFHYERHVMKESRTPGYYVIPRELFYCAFSLHRPEIERTRCEYTQGMSHFNFIAGGTLQLSWKSYFCNIFPSRCTLDDFAKFTLLQTI